MNVAFEESFLKDLRGVKDKSLLRRVRELIEMIEQVQSQDMLTGLKKLKGGGNYYRLRIGDHRVGITIENQIVTFVRFLNRKEIYRFFP
ncbi:MAG: type II toxin-antitoxin system RelE family toxin [Pyrinomonadaceae bacterium]